MIIKNAKKNFLIAVYLILKKINLNTHVKLFIAKLNKVNQVGMIKLNILLLVPETQKAFMPTKKIKILLGLFATLFFFLLACKKNYPGVTQADPVAAYLNLPASPLNYSNTALPAYLLSPPIQGQVNTPTTNPITDWGATLGRVLFYDKNLSKNLTLSCASCHKQPNAFSDFEKLSKGFDGGLTGRNSMSLINAVYYPNGRFFWDQRASTLEQQVLTPIQDLVEMGITIDTLVKRVQSLPYYPSLFTKAFGTPAINSDLISKSLSQFVRSIVSYQSKYDQGRQTFPATPAPPPNAPFPNFTAQENRGKEIFLAPQNACAACHGTETFTAPDVRNNGIDALNIDLGFGAVSKSPADYGLFKVSSLRNVELTAPYMHDGRFNTLEEVVEHYNTGIKNNPNLSEQLRLPGGQPKVLNLTIADKAALVVFLKTLTDRNVTSDIKFSNPFK
jgi:cytochrome c peroxidase